MKKLIIGVLIFVVISVGITGVLIKMQNNKTENTFDDIDVEVFSRV